MKLKSFYLKWKHRLKLFLGIYEPWEFSASRDCYIYNVATFIELFNTNVMQNLAKIDAENLLSSPKTRFTTVMESLETCSRDALWTTFEELAKKPIVYR